MADVLMRGAARVRQLTQTGEKHNGGNGKAVPVTATAGIMAFIKNNNNKLEAVSRK